MFSITAQRRTLQLFLIVVLGLVTAFSLTRWIDARRLPDSVIEEDRLYLTGNTARRMSLVFNGLVADWYWMRSLQYVGRRIINLPQNVELDDLGRFDLKLLAPLLDAATTLDPEFMAPYEYAAVVLPEVDMQQAIQITRKGLEANPTAWRLYQHLGYIYWQQHDYQAASEIYGKGAALPGAPTWMEAMKARIAAEGGSRSTAREIYARIYEQSEDAGVRDMARRRLMQLDSFDERDAIRKILAAYQTQVGRCPSSWKEIEPVLRAIRLPLDGAGAPIDPGGAPYLLQTSDCDVALDPKSQVPYK